MTEAILSKLVSAPLSGIDSCVGGSDTRSTVRIRSLIAVRLVLWHMLGRHEVHYKTQIVSIPAVDRQPVQCSCCGAGFMW